MELESYLGGRNMETVEINIEFESIEAVNKWEEENIPDRMYNGRCIMCGILPVSLAKIKCC